MIKTCIIIWKVDLIISCGTGYVNSEVNTDKPIATDAFEEKIERVIRDIRPEMLKKSPTNECIEFRL